ncbi:MAG: ferrous iron transporter B [Deltaproteobacteria bacterium]|nr:ferrous iron transporter B [Deltaproteobacteria bacterium]
MMSTTSSLKKIMIVGCPNTGKSQMFVNLTGEYTLVANAPLTTIEMKRATARIGDALHEIIDTPGFHGLSLDSEEDFLVLKAIFTEKPDIIVQCIDANRLKQSLALTVDLLTLGLPLVISLNAIDETARKGIRIDSDRLAHILDVPVVESMVVHGQGTKKLEAAIQRARAGKQALVLKVNRIENSLSKLEAQLEATNPFRRAVALLLVQNYQRIWDYLKDHVDAVTMAGLKREVEVLNRQYRGNIKLALDNRRNQWLDDLELKVIRKHQVSKNEILEGFARLTRHPFFGLPILLMVLYLMFQLVVNVANGISEWMYSFLWNPTSAFLGHILPAGFWQDLLIGEHGVLSMGLANALLTVLPILTVFFLFFNTLEDVGYLPNLSVLSRRLLMKFGLGGNALMPLVLGFGCKTMATLTTKTIPSRRERYITIYLIAFAIPCVAQLGLNMSILGRMGWTAFLIAFCVLAFMEISAGLLLNQVLRKSEERLDFILELPQIRLPSPRWVIKKTFYRLYWFLRESILVFLYAALALFIADRIGLLTAGKHLLSPIIEGLLGLPLAMVDAVILCIARREAAAAVIINLVRKGEMNYVQCIVAVIVTTTFFPCLANLMAMVRQVGPRDALIMSAFISLTALMTGSALNWVLVWVM